MNLGTGEDGGVVEAYNGTVILKPGQLWIANPTLEK
jgi:hypothetical protein